MITILVIIKVKEIFKSIVMYDAFKILSKNTISYCEKVT